jgi:hypothetical protein
MQSSHSGRMQSQCFPLGRYVACGRAETKVHWPRVSPLHLNEQMSTGATRGSLGCRYCCKSPKLSGDNFHAIRRSDRRPTICVASITFPGSPVSLSSDDEVPPHLYTKVAPTARRIFDHQCKRTFATKSANCGLMQCSKQLLYSITSSARTRIAGEIVIPIALAVLRFRTNSNLVGCSTGRSPALAPFAIRSTYSAARRNMAGKLAP